jgi:hypothetical protein
MNITVSVQFLDIRVSKNWTHSSKIQRCFFINASRNSFKYKQNFYQKHESFKYKQIFYQKHEKF